MRSPPFFENYAGNRSGLTAGQLSARQSVSTARRRVLRRPGCGLHVWPSNRWSARSSTVARSMNAAFLLAPARNLCGYGSKSNHQKTAGFGPCFHLPGNPFWVPNFDHSRVRLCIIEPSTSQSWPRPVVHLIKVDAGAGGVSHALAAKAQLFSRGQSGGLELFRAGKPIY